MPAKLKRTVTFESYEDFERSQQACLIGVTRLLTLSKLLQNNLDYHGTMEYLLLSHETDLSQYN